MISLFRKYLFAVLLFSIGTIQASHELSNNRLSSPSLVNGSILSVTDNKYSLLSAAVPGTINFQEATSLLRVRAGIDKASTNYLSAFDVSFIVKVDYQTYSGGVFTPVTTTQTLQVSYDPALGGAQYKDLSVLEVQGGYLVQVEVLDIIDNLASGASITTPPVSIYLEAETDAERYYNMDYYNKPYSGNPSLSINYLSNSNEFEISWMAITGAEEYDLEWTWISDDVNASYPVLLDFRNNSTRVRVSSQSYRISQVFEKGKVFVRLRGVGRYDGNSDGKFDDVIYTPWTLNDFYSSTVSAISALTCASSYPVSSYYFCITADHEQNKNWQYKSTYAEEGKKKEVISYFDGTLRNRQSVTKVNSDDNAIVGETYYDYQGRAAVQALPVPVADAKIKFYQYNVTSSSSVSGWGFNFSKTTKEPYSREHFDLDNTPGSCEPNDVGMEDTISYTDVSGTIRFGSSNYYSSYNIDKTFQQGYVPNAEYYPFTQTEYEPDNTGRIARQSGVGPNHKLGSGHETKYFYGSPTTQQELDRFFGSDVGDYKHYKKNMVIDANGQISISYLDQEGRTVATALAGNNPSNTYSLATNSGTPATYSGDLLNKDNSTDVDDEEDNNILMQGGKELSFSKDFLVTENNAIYKFSYDMTGTAFTYSCSSANFCYDCVYDLRIDILDKCGNRPTGFTPAKKAVGNILESQYLNDTTLSSYNYSCDGPIQFSIPQSAMTVTLQPGAYTVYKTLSINEDALSAYLDHYINENTCIRNEQSFIDSAMAHIDTSGCNLTCEACAAALGSVDSYTANGGTVAEYNRLVKECYEPCEYTSQCEAAKIAMMADMSPGGQYADWENTNGDCDPSGFPLSVLNTSNSLPNRGTSPTWKNPDGGHYYDEDGNIDFVEVVMQPDGSYLPTVASGVTPSVISGNTYSIEPQQLNDVCDFKNSWKNSWATSLLKYHPEYYYYEWCIKNGTDNVSANNYTVTYNGNDGHIETSEHFDSLLVNIEDMTLITSGNSTKLWDPLGAYSSNPVGDPYFDTNDPASKWYVTSQTAYILPSSYDQLNHSGNFLGNPFFPKIYTNAKDRFNNYLGSGLNLWEFTYTIVKNCASNFGTSITSGSSCFPSGVTHNYDLFDPSVNTSISTQEAKQAWEKFKFMYLSLKQTLQNEAAQSYALNYTPTSNVTDTYNSCNDCIGTQNFDPYHVAFAAWQNFFGVGSWFNNWYFGPKAPCSMYTKDLYASKVKRFPSTQDVLNLSHTNNTASIYQLTGKCPEALDLEALTNYMGQNGLMTTSTNLHTIPAFTQNLYNFLYANVHGGSTPSSYPDLTWTPTQYGNTLSVGFGTNLGGTCNLSLVFPSNAQGFNWGNTGSGSNLITRVYDIKYLSYNGSQSNFTMKLDVTTSTAAYTYTITGTICGNIGACTFAQDCEPNTTAIEFTKLFDHLSVEGKLCTSANTHLGSTPFDATFNLLLPSLPPGGDWVWNKTSSTGGYITDYTATNSVMVGIQSTGTPDFQTKLCPAANHSISIQSIVPDPSGTTGNFILTYQDFDYTSGSLATTTGSITGNLFYKVNSGSSPIPYNLGTCSNPNPLCQTTEHQVKADLEKFLTQNSLSTFTVSTPVKITAGKKFSFLLMDYVSGVNNVGSGNALTYPDYFWMKSSSSSSTSIIGSICTSTTGSAPSSTTSACCQLSLSFLNSNSTHDLQQASAFSGLTVLNDPTIGGQQYTFTLTAFFGSESEPVIGSSSCFPLRECLSCSDGTVAAYNNCNTVLENFDNISNPSALPYPYPDGSFAAPCASVTPQSYSYNSNPATLNYTQYTLLTDTVNGVAPFADTSFFMRIGECQGNSVAYFKIASGLSTSTNYNLSFAANLINFTSSSAVLSLYVNSNQVASQTVANTQGTWTMINFPFNISSTSDTLSIRVQKPSTYSSYMTGILGLDELKLCTRVEGEYKLCVDSLPTDTFPEITYVNPCVQAAIDDAYSEALDNYTNYIDSLKEDFVEKYIQKCMGYVVENFNLEYSSNEYHFTLYYYDQAGNLVQTVPPQGVHIVTGTDLQTAKSDRAARKTSPSTAKTFETQHSMVTTYSYNSLNQLIKQQTPDAGLSYFWYDKLGRLIASQNAKQAAASGTGPYQYSYTKYDALGRIKEVGQMTVSNNFVGASYVILQGLLNPSGNNYPENLTPTKEQITTTWYGDDDTYFTTLASIPSSHFTGLTDAYSRGRVVASHIEAVNDNNAATYDHATYYNYDVHGNVKELIQHNPALSSFNQDFKVMNYDYDLVSGKVNTVSYQPGQADQFYHKYEYDADNRITNVWTSKDHVIWDQDAKYFYYKHGPLARVEIGDDKVQGLDYAYTIHGWIKGVNSNNLSEVNDMGKDGNASCLATNYNNLHSYVARDAYGYSLNYYSDGTLYDYKAIDNTLTSSTHFIAGNSILGLGSVAPALYNGNISHMVTTYLNQDPSAVYPGTSTGIGVNTPYPQLNAYKYDQLNRIAHAQSYRDFNFSSNAFNSTSDTKYQEDFTYDANGNILTLNRNGNSSAMDNLTYHYYDNTGSTYAASATTPAPANATNKLAYVDDAIANGVYNMDIDDQASGNYTYDAIGNLISDATEEIASIEWTVYGKIKKITRNTGSTKANIEFAYDAQGNRISKFVSYYITTPNLNKITYYMRDAQGNVMATYDKTFPNGGQYAFTLNDQHIYGSSRLGVINRGLVLSTTYIPNPPAIPAVSVRSLGAKNYELSNHLGNVIAVVTDKKIPVYEQEDLLCVNLFNESGNYEGWTTGGAYYSYIIDNGKMKVTVNHDNDVGVNKTIKTVPGHTYKITFDLDYCGGTAFNVRVGAKDEDNNVWYAGSPNYSSAGTYTYMFTANSDSTRLKLMSNDLSGNTYTMCFDNISIRDMYAVLDKNTFSTSGNYEGWTTGGSYYSYTISSNKMKVTVNHAVDVGVNKTITTIPGHTYQVTFDLDYCGGTAFNVLIDAKDEINGVWYTSSPNYSSAGTYVYTITANSTTTRFKLMSNDNSGNTYTMCFDNIEFKDLSIADGYVYYLPEIVNSSDYYSFGSAMPGRFYNATAGYRYGFNGKENDREANSAGEGTQDYGMRIYNPSLGRFLSVDPLTEAYPWYTPYQFAGNDVIRYIDIDGEEQGEPSFYKKNGGFVTAIDNTGRTIIPEKNIQIQYYRALNYKPKTIYDLPITQNKEEIKQGGIYADDDYIASTTNMDNMASFTVPGYDVGKKYLKGEKITKTELGIEILGLIPIGKVFKPVGKVFKGIGGEILEAFAKKVENQATHLTNKDLLGAVKDIMGKPIVIGGKQYDHLKEVTEALKGLGNQIEKLNKAIDSGKLTGDVLDEAKRLRKIFQAEKDRITNVLDKAKKEAAKKAKGN